MYFIIGIVIVGIVGLPGLANAMDAEYIVYNGFIPLYNSFTKLALISSDTSFKSLYAVAIVVSIFVSGALNVATMMKNGGKGTGLAWAMPLLAGIVVFMGMFSSTGTIHLYDPVLNKTGDIGGVPDGIIAIARVTNSIETGLVDMISTSGTPGDYQRSAGGIGFNMAANTANTSASNTDATSAFSNYVKDCVMYELSRPGTTLTWNELMTSTDLWGTTLPKAQNPAIYTQNSLSGTVSEDPPSATCTDSFNSLRAYYTNPANMAAVKTAMCTQAGYDNTATGLTQCAQEFSNTTQATAGSSDTPETYLAGAEVSRMFMDTLKSASPQQAAALLTNKQQTNGVTAGFAMAAWIPHLKALFTAAILGLIPTLIIFIPTSICGRALGLILGFFILIMTWGVTDAVLHSIMMDYAVTYFTDVASSGKSLYYYLSFPDNSTSAMAMFGYMRSAGLGLASMVTMQLAKFGGAQLAGVTTGIMEGLKSNAVQSGDVATTEDKRGSYLNSMLAGHAGMANFAHHGAGHLMNQVEFGGERLGGEKGIQERAGQMRAGNAGQYGHTSEMKATEELAKFQKFDHNTAQMSGAVAGAAAVETLKVLNETPGGAVATAENNARVETMKKTAANAKYGEMVDNYAAERGLNPADAKQRAQAFGEFAALDLANNKALMQAWNGDVGAYTKFLEGSQHLSQGERDAVMKVASDAGLDLRTFAKDKATIDRLAEVGKIEATQPDLVLSRLQNNLSKGDFDAIKGDGPQMLAMGALLGKEEKDITAADMGQAQTTLTAWQAPDTAGIAANDESIRNAQEGLTSETVRSAIKENVAAGNYGSILQDKDQLAAMTSATGKSPEELRAAPPEQQQAYMKQTQMKLAAEEPRRDGNTIRANLQRNLQSGNFAAIMTNPAQKAAMAQLVGKPADTLQSNDVQPAQTRLDAIQKPNAAGATKLQALKQKLGTASEADVRDAGRVGLLTDAGRLDAWKHLQTAAGMNARQATEFMDTHRNIDSVAAYKDFDASSQALGDMLGKDDYSGMMKGYLQKEGMQDRVLNQKEADALNKQMHAHGQKHFHAKAGNQVRFAYDATTGKVGMAVSTGGGKSDYYDLDAKSVGKDWQKVDRDVSTVDKGIRSRVGNDFWSGTKRILDDINLKVTDKGVRSKIGSDFWSGQKKVHEDTDLNVINKGLRRDVGVKDWSGQTRVDEHTNISTSSDYVKVDRALDAKKDAKLIMSMNEQLARRGSKQRVEAAMHFQAIYDKGGNIASWDIKSGGKSAITDLKETVTGDTSTIHAHDKKLVQGYDVKGSTTGAIEKAAKFLGADEQTADAISGAAATLDDIATGVLKYGNVGAKRWGDRRKRLEKEADQKERKVEQEARDEARRTEKAGDKEERRLEKEREQTERAHEKAENEAKRAREQKIARSGRILEKNADSRLPKPGNQKPAPRTRTSRPSQAAREAAPAPKEPETTPHRPSDHDIPDFSTSYHPPESAGYATETASPHPGSGGRPQPFRTRPGSTGGPYHGGRAPQESAAPRGPQSGRPQPGAGRTQPGGTGRPQPGKKGKSPLPTTKKPLPR